MDYSIFDFLQLIGSLGLFLYGMKMMSEGLQKIAGDRMRSILSAMTSNRFMGVFTGLLITALIQSSSATTVMVVSFVNAGLLSLAQSISVIMGANIGTTLTAWIISFFGFAVDISAFAIPLIGLAIPFFFSGKSKRRSIGELILGFSFLFMGLAYLKNSVPDIKSNPEVLEFLQNYADMGYWSVLTFFFVGAVLTLIVQSSSATVAITLIMCSQGWIPFEAAAAMVLGENLGTTITANIAAISGNVQAKRAAFSHFIFNIFGVIWMLILFYPFVRMIEGLAESMTGLSPDALQSFVNEHPELTSKDPAVMATIDPAVQSKYISYQTTVSYGMSLFHTIYNIINVSIMIWFVKVYVKIVSAVIKQKKGGEEEEFQLKYISAGMLSTSELSLLQAKKEIELYGVRITRMYGMARDLMSEKPDSEAFNKLYSRIQKYEQISDNMELEIARYLNNVSDGRLSFDGKMKVNTMMTETTEIESIGDSCYSIARAIQRKNSENIVFNEYILDHINNMFRLTYSALENMNNILSKADIDDADINKTYNIEMEINNYRNMLRTANMDNINNKKYEYKAGIHFMDIISECEKLGDYVVNVIDAVREKRSIKK
ncbi:MAG: Na/Pi cotransporter family protein [Bacteroidales bacterium]|nr:Na/Pi cotransporter family protein [Bacteroidales bacterium]